MLNQLLKPVLERLPENNRMERIWVLAKTDFLKRYYGSMLGLIWAFINPVVQLLIYYFVFTNIFNSKVPNFALFLFLGLVIWMFFAEATSKGLVLFRTKRYLLENIQMNWLDIYYASIASFSFAFIFNFAAYFIVSLFFTISVSTQVILLPLLILNLLIFILSVQLILSVIQVFLRDIVHLWDLGKMILFWLSGIFFPVDSITAFGGALIPYLTPLPGIIHNARNILIYGEDIHWFYFCYDYAYALILLGIATWFFKNFAGKALEKL